MNSISYRKKILAALLVSAFGCGFAVAQDTSSGTSAEKSQDSSGGSEKGKQGEGQKSKSEHGNRAEERREARAQKHVNDAAKVVARMEKTDGMDEVLQNSRGVFIIPSYGGLAAGVGVDGGAGVMLTKQKDGSWSNPVFYDIAGLDIGFQAGGEGGPMAFILNDEKAVDRFMKNNHFSLDADTGITIVEWSKRGQGTAGMGDVLVWAQEKGLFANIASIGVEDIHFNRTLTRAYYGERDVTPEKILMSKDINPKAKPLQQALSEAAPKSTATGASGSSSDSSSGNTGAAEVTEEVTVETIGPSDGSSPGASDGTSSGSSDKASSGSSDKASSGSSDSSSSGSKMDNGSSSKSQ